MILHFLEVWSLLLLAFGLGSVLGALGYELLAMTTMSGVQIRWSNVVGSVVERAQERLGISPAFREYRYIPAEPAAPLPGPRDRHDKRRIDPPRRTPPRPGQPGLRPRSHQPRDAADVPPPIAADEREPAREENRTAAMRPASLLGPRQGVPDNLQRIHGIGKKNEALLNELGIFHFGQIAAWTPAEVEWIAERMAFPERIGRDDWIGQAVILASGGHTGVEKSADRRRARRSERYSDHDGSSVDRHPETSDEPIDEEAEGIRDVDEDSDWET